MTEDSVARYQDAFVAYKQSARRFDEVVAVVVRTAATLKEQPHAVRVGQMKASPRRSAVLQWPSEESLQTAIREWDEALHEMQNAWDAIPANRREGLSPPPVPRS